MDLVASRGVGVIRVYWSWGFRGITLLSTNLHSTFALILGLEAYFLLLLFFGVLLDLLLFFAFGWI